MQIRDVQQLLAKAGLYPGAIDGDAGPLTMRAVAAVLQAAQVAEVWPKGRLLIAAGQAVLAALGHEPGKIDGLWGHNTREALNDFLTTVAQGRVLPIERTPVPGAAEAKAAQLQWPKQSEMAKFFGAAGSALATAGRVLLPYPFRIAWDLAAMVAGFSAHEKVAPALTSIFAEAVKHYGRDRFDDLGLSLYGGCFNNRTMRGGQAKSTHAFGAAVDLDPERNQLRWGRDRATFAQSAYDDFWRIVEAHGAVSLGRAANMDWMHFQFARL